MCAKRNVINRGFEAMKVVVDDTDDVLDACGEVSCWIDWLKTGFINKD